MNCIICNKETIYHCPFCRLVARTLIALCENPLCREKHEEDVCSRTIKADI